MKKILLISLIISQIVFAKEYDYPDSVIVKILQGCANGGGSKNFCTCYVVGVMNNVPPKELTSFEFTVRKLESRGNKNFNSEDFNEQHMVWLRGLMKTCGGL